MEIKKETTISAMTTNNKIINVGDSVVFEAIGKCFAGIFLGFGRNGALKFKSGISGIDVTFNVMPNSIKKIYKATIQIQDEPFMNLPEGGAINE